MSAPATSGIASGADTVPITEVVGSEATVTLGTGATVPVSEHVASAQSVGDVPMQEVPPTEEGGNESGVQEEVTITVEVEEEEGEVTVQAGEEEEMEEEEQGVEEEHEEEEYHEEEEQEEEEQHEEEEQVQEEVHVDAAAQHAWAGAEEVPPTVLFHYRMGRDRQVPDEQFVIAIADVKCSCSGDCRL